MENTCLIGSTEVCLRHLLIKIPSKYQTANHTYFISTKVLIDEVLHWGLDFGKVAGIPHQDKKLC